MPQYCFRDIESGEELELFFPMNSAPSIGDVIDHDGRKLERRVSKGFSVPDPFKSYTTRVCSGGIARGLGMQVDKNDNPVVNSRA